MKIQEDNDFNHEYWTFVKLIIDNPTKYLKLEAQILYKIVEHNGVITSQKLLSKELNISNKTVSHLCKELQSKGVITRKNLAQNYIITFNTKMLRTLE